MPSPAPPSGPLKLPPAPVAPGTTIVNTLAPPGLAARLHADYDRDGTLDATEAEHLLRLRRPGAIILPNLDISDKSLLAAPVPTDLVTVLDGLDDTINGPADQKQLTPARFEQLAGVASRAAGIFMRVDPKDAARIRGFITLGGALTFIAFADSANTDMFVSFDPLIGIDPDFLLEAITFPGDPKLPAPTGASPSKPLPAPAKGKSGPFGATLPAGSSGSPVFSKRAPGDVWVELVHQDAGSADLKSPREVALFTIAPFLLLGGHLPAKRIFVVNAIDLTLGVGFIPGNHNFIFDLMEACQAVFGAANVALPPNDAAPFTPSTPAFTGPFYLIDGAKFPDTSAKNLARPAGQQFVDPWIQDEIEIGYCFAPHASMHVVLHCKRNRGLDKFVHAELPGSSVGLFDALHAPDAFSDSVHYGGNLEATPPIDFATPALGAGAAGPAVKAHKAAPFGKILLGDFRPVAQPQPPPPQAPRPPRKLDADYRDFLIAQHVQPVLPLDTSWLDVGHVDEIISFVADSSPKGFKLLYASINTMTVLLKEAKKVPVSSGRTNFHRGKWLDFLKKTGYDEISVEDLLLSSKPFNDRVRAEKTIPIDQRLKAGLHLEESDIVRIPTYFLPPEVPKPKLTDTPTSAFTVGMVNMLVLGSDLIIPKPFGPRMKVADATAVLTRAFAQLGIKASITMPATGDKRWVEAGDLPERMVCYYTDPPTAADRQDIVEHIKDSSQPLSPANAILVGLRAVEIAGANAANGLLQTSLLPVIGGSAFTVWQRINVPDDKVDLIEAYMLSVLSPLGVTIHFVDDWFYHFQEGEAHCGTNAIRKLPEDSDPKRWWDKYDPSIDVSYKP